MEPVLLRLSGLGETEAFFSRLPELFRGGLGDFETCLFSDSSLLGGLGDPCLAFCTMLLLLGGLGDLLLGLSDLLLVLLPEEHFLAGGLFLLSGLGELETFLSLLSGLGDLLFRFSGLGELGTFLPFRSELLRLEEGLGDICLLCLSFLGGLGDLEVVRCLGDFFMSFR